MTMTSFVPPIGWVPPGDQTGGTSCESFGADPSAASSTNTIAINAALAVGGLVTLTQPGTYYCACLTKKTVGPPLNIYNVALIIPSNTKFVCGPGVVLKVDNGVTNPCLIQNQNIVSGDSNIQIEGGVWDGNRDASTASPTSNYNANSTFAQITIWMQNISTCRFRGMQVVNPLAWGFACAAITNGWFEDTYFNYSGGTMGSQNQGGFQFEGAQSNIFIKNTKGNTYDDLIALVAYSGTSGANAGLVSSMAGYGPINGVYIDGVISDTTACWNHVRLNDNTTNTIQNVSISNVQGPYNNASIRMGSASVTEASFLRNIKITGGNVSQFSSSAANQVGTIHIDGNVDSLSVSRYSRVQGSTETPKPLFEVTTVSQTPIIKNLTLDDMMLDGSLGGSGSGANAYYFSNGTTQTLIAHKLRHTASLQSGAGQGNSINLSANAQITSAHITDGHFINAQRMIILDGVVSSVTMMGCTDTGQVTSNAEAIRIRGTVPNLTLIGNYINICSGGSPGLTSGAINLNGSAATTVIRSWGNVIQNAGTTIAKAGSEGLRWHGLDVPVNSTVINGSVLGDVFIDFNTQLGVMCTTAPTGYKQL